MMIQAYLKRQVTWIIVIKTQLVIETGTGTQILYTFIINNEHNGKVYALILPALIHRTRLTKNVLPGFTVIPGFGCQHRSGLAGMSASFVMLSATIQPGLSPITLVSL